LLLELTSGPWFASNDRISATCQPHVDEFRASDTRFGIGDRADVFGHQLPALTWLLIAIAAALPLPLVVALAISLANDSDLGHFDVGLGGTSCSFTGCPPRPDPAPATTIRVDSIDRGRGPPTRRFTSKLVVLPGMPINAGGARPPKRIVFW
jgi:hypothetical protein